MPEYVAGRADTEADREAIYQLRYQVYVEEMKKTLAAADHSSRALRDDADEGANLFYVKIDGRPVGTLRWIWGGSAFPKEYAEEFPLGRLGSFPLSSVGFSSRLMILPEFRHTSALRVLLSEAYRYARTVGAWLDFLHCAPGLIPLYEALGYRRVALKLVRAESAGSQLTMACVLDDVDYLSAAGSFFAREGKALSSDPAHADWFRRTFAGMGGPTSRRLMGDEEFTRQLGDALDLGQVDLFAGISQEGIDTVLRQASFLELREGETVVRAGDVGRELFLIQDGLLEARLPQGTGYVVASTMTAGDVFGEVAFVQERRRSADVVCLTPANVLVISPEAVDKLISVNSELAARLLLNVSRVLAARLGRLGHLAGRLGD